MKNKGTWIIVGIVAAFVLLTQGEQRGIPRSVRYEDHGTADAQTQ